MTLVSIITPSFNQAAYLRQCMRSVLSQDHPELEYVVVDGGSSDDSPAIIREYADRLAWWVSEKDSGQAEAINKGLAHCRGEVVAWLNSDDYYLPGAVTAAVRVMEAHPGVALVYSNMQAVDQEGRLLNVLRYRQQSLEDLLCFGIIGQPATFMRRAAVEAAGGLDPDFHFLLDHQLWIRLASRADILHVKDTWAAARYHAAAKNRAMAQEFGREAFRIVEWASHDPRVQDVLKPIRRRARAAAHRVEARYLVDAGQPWRALGAWMQAFLLHPPTALARLNLLFSSLLGLCGLSALRQTILDWRRKRLAA
jgi:glycosyltransferase involved in cell wall biosynthesis